MHFELEYMYLLWKIFLISAKIFKYNNNDKTNQNFFTLERFFVTKIFEEKKITWNISFTFFKVFMIFTGLDNPSGLKILGMLLKEMWSCLRLYGWQTIVRPCVANLVNNFNPVQSRLIMFNHVKFCLILFNPIQSCTILFNHVHSY